MHRFYTEEILILGISADIKGEEARHSRDVLRLKPGDRVLLFDGSGMEFTGEITRIRRDAVSVDIIEERKGDTESPIEIVLGQGIPKSDKMELIVQKGTELGISRIVPLYTERVISKAFSPNKLDRWQRIAVEACKQSGRVKLPVISEPVRLDMFMKDAGPSSLKLIPWEGEKETSLRKAFPAALIDRKLFFIVGPEGGLTESEIGLAKENGFIPVSLGKRILRTETVSLALISIVQHLYGDLS